MRLRSTISWTQLTIGLIFIINPFIDAITGYLVLSGLITQGSVGSPSQLFRLFLSVLMLVQIRKRSHLRSVILFVLYIICLELFNFTLHADPSGLAVGITYSYKMAFGLLMFFVIDRYLTEKKNSFQKLLDYIILSGVIYSAIVLISDTLGISFGSYGDEIGSRGIFASANGLGIYVGVCSLVLLYRYHNKPKKIYLVYYILMAYTLLGLMTRAAILLLAVGLILWFLQMPNKLKIPALALAFIVVMIFIEPITNIVTASTEMIAYRFKNTDISLHTLFIGGRQFLFDRAANQFTYDGGLWYRLIIGGGYFLSFRNPFNVDYSISSILEADLWDVFYMFGIIGIITYFWLFCYGLTYKGIQSDCGYILKIAWVLIFFHSALAGHVIQSGQSVMMVVCLLLLLRYRKELNTNYERTNEA